MLEQNIRPCEICINNVGFTILRQSLANAAARFKQPSIVLQSSHICRAITEYSTSIGLVSSYNDGASHNIIKVPTNEAIIKIHKNSRSNTIATKPQS
uniref:Uncharacterized protein n=1 Tax=Glossina austeni TaxID=7395 RepID=A0A1A9VTK5_GLOAU